MQIQQVQAQRARRTAPWEPARPESPVRGGPYQNSSRTESPQQTAAQISSLAQGTVHTETVTLALPWVSGPVARRSSYCLVELSFQGQSAKDGQLDSKSLRAPTVTSWRERTMTYTGKSQEDLDMEG